MPHEIMARAVTLSIVLHEGKVITSIGGVYEAFKGQRKLFRCRPHGAAIGAERSVNVAREG
jgi:hypothetical protein